MRPAPATRSRLLLTTLDRAEDGRARAVPSTPLSLQAARRSQAGSRFDAHHGSFRVSKLVRALLGGGRRICTDQAKPRLRKPYAQDLQDRQAGGIVAGS